ncbi:hypothetical protein CLV80_105296 [Yoonia maritima]|uniref:Dolichyl-phosphate-mannose-protein mannosyltransferase n=1 Tax=Yoonia maritima TaxID=1435347 RepID=A0A2T0VZP9_9RHOB|nr:hypothetical protein [Yoonia maritima]PRY77812.1 hypothetical protein CLV80_105296 [Yoonia maritima]
MNKDFSTLCACLCAIAGATLYALLAFGVIFPPDYPYFGTDIYNAYFYRLLEGRFDLPVRMLRYEGHYFADGVGLLYHGIAPLLTRAVLYPFVTLNQFPTAAFSIWLWSVVGTAIYHLSVVQVMHKFVGPIAGRMSVFWGMMIGIGIWICSPGLLLSTNLALYHEPISIAYAAMALAIYLMLRFALFGMPMKYVLIPAALLAGLLIHSRPHMAVGLYAGIATLMCLSLFRRSDRSPISVLSSLILLAALGGSFLQLNAMRFGSMTETHGHFETPDSGGGTQYGVAFFESDYDDYRRKMAFVEHERFHPWRMIPNLGVYVFDHPVYANHVGTIHRKLTESISGFGRIEVPKIGLMYLWPAWIVLMVVGLCYGRPRFVALERALPAVVTAGVAAGMLLSYPTITLRYHFELWPLVVVLCLLTFPGLIKEYGPQSLTNSFVLKLSVVLLVTGAIFSGLAALWYTYVFEMAPGTFHEAWDANRCMTEVQEKGFSRANGIKLCIDPGRIYEVSSEG